LLSNKRDQGKVPGILGVSRAGPRDFSRTSKQRFRCRHVCCSDFAAESREGLTNEPTSAEQIPWVSPCASSGFLGGL